MAAVKEQNGAAMSLGRTSTFLDIYIERDLKNGFITEQQAQEYIDHFIMKLRLIKFARDDDLIDIFAQYSLNFLGSFVDQSTVKFGSGAQVGPRYRPVTGEYLEYDDVMQKFDDMMEWLAGLYVNTFYI